MLEKQDFEMLQHMMREVVDESIAKNNEVFGAELEERLEKRLEEKIGKRIDESIAKNNEVFGAELEERLEEKLGKRIDESIAKNNEVFGAELEERIKEQTCKQIETAIAKSENLLLDEMERYHNISQNEIKKLNRKMDEITEYYRIKHLNDDVCDTLLLLYRKQQGEIENIKKVIAV